MLAQLLRNLLLSQVVIGAALGYWLGQPAPLPLASMFLVALALPVATMVVVDTISALWSRAAEPWSPWWRSLVGEYVAGVVIFLFRQPWTRGVPQVLPATGQPTQVPVVLIHGYMCNHRIWDDVAKVLRQQGHTVIAINLEPVYASIDRYVPIVQGAVDGLCESTGAQQVALVGHSMGGLAIRAWMRVHGTTRVARAITLGTPHQGTQIARSVRSPNGKQMAWKSPWLTELAAAETDATRALFRIAISPQDNIVFPQREQVMPGVPVQVFEGLGHLQMCLDPEVIAWVSQQLSEISHARH